MKKLIALLMALVMVLSMAACGAKTEAPAADEQAAAPADFKVGAIYINSKNDTAGYTLPTTMASPPPWASWAWTLRPSC